MESILAAANMLQLHYVIEAASNFLINQLHPSNCLGIRSFASLQVCQKLFQKAHAYTMVCYAFLVLVI